MFLFVFTDEKTESKYCKMYSLHERVMMKLAMKILKNQKDSEDVVQDCFLTFLENEKLMQKFEAPDSPATKSYLMMMVKSRAINLYKKIKHQNAVMDDDENLLYRIADEKEDVEEILANAEMLAEAGQYLKILDPMDINIMTLKYYQGLQNTEIAELLNIDSNLVGVRIYRAKKRLAAEVQSRKDQKGAAENE